MLILSFYHATYTSIQANISCNKTTENQKRTLVVVFSILLGKFTCRLFLWIPNCLPLLISHRHPRASRAWTGTEKGSRTVRAVQEDAEVIRTLWWPGHGTEISERQGRQVRWATLLPVGIVKHVEKFGLLQLCQTLFSAKTWASREKCWKNNSHLRYHSKLCQHCFGPKQTKGSIGSHLQQVQIVIFVFCFAKTLLGKKKKKNGPKQWHNFVKCWNSAHDFWRLPKHTFYLLESAVVFILLGFVYHVLKCDAALLTLPVFAIQHDYEQR